MTDAAQDALITRETLDQIILRLGFLEGLTRSLIDSAERAGAVHVAIHYRERLAEANKTLPNPLFRSGD